MKIKSSILLHFFATSWNLGWNLDILKVSLEVFMEVWQLKTQKTLNFSQFEKKENFFTKKKKHYQYLMHI
jgi:hypothetical protein